MSLRLCSFISQGPTLLHWWPESSFKSLTIFGPRLGEVVKALEKINSQNISTDYNQKSCTIFSIYCTNAMILVSRSNRALLPRVFFFFELQKPAFTRSTWSQHLRNFVHASQSMLRSTFYVNCYLCIARVPFVLSRFALESLFSLRDRWIVANLIIYRKNN